MTQGPFEHEGKELKIMHGPYLAEDTHLKPPLPCYQALAMDAESNEYFVKWKVINAEGAQSEACDWLKPYKVDQI